MTKLSPQAQAVLDAATNVKHPEVEAVAFQCTRLEVAAALRAVAASHSENLYDQHEGKVAVVRSDLVLAITTELENP